MSTQKAIVTQGPGVAEVISNHTIPSVLPNHMRINGKSVEINPTERKPIEHKSVTRGAVGVDYSAVVQEVQEVTC